MTSNASGLAFRISNIPKEITGDQLLQLLNRLHLDIYTYGKLDNQNVLGWSLAPAAASADAGRYSTATVTFNSLPTEFKFAGPSKSIHLVPYAPPVNVDKHFYGFTPLAAPSHPQIDIIAVTGLAGHAFGSWKARGGCAMWLRDFLPEHVPGARILSYGYDSTLLKNNSTASIHEFSCNLLGNLNTVRANDDEKHRPIIFIGHSLGGLVIKQALTDAAQSYNQNSSIFLSCYALLLFGVPNLGLEVVSLRSLVKDQPNSSLIADLDASSAFLRRHNFFWEFQKAEGTRVISVYETKPTPTVQKTAGVWKQTGPEVMMVSRASAVSATPEGNADDIFSIDANHSNIVKFKTNTSHSYLNIRTRIMSLADAAPAVISRRFEVLSESAQSPVVASATSKAGFNMRSMFTQFRGEVEEKKETDIKQWLSTVEFIKHHRHALEGIVQGTGKWLFQTAQFSEWRSFNVSNILWLHGMPGAGKTKLTSMVIESLSPPHSSNGSYHTHEPVLFFYCNRDEPQRRDPTTIMQSLLKQLAMVLPGLPKPVVAKYDQRIEGAGSLEFTECTELLISLLHIFPHTTIVIDGLDECDPMVRGRLLETLTTIVHSAPATSVIKLFISSRDDIDIKLRLDTVSNRYIEARDNKEDIERFIHRELHQPNSRLSKLSDNLKHQVHDTLSAAAGGMFQWVSLQIMHLNGMTLEEDILENLGKLPKSLTEAYAQIHDSMREGTPREWELTRKALMWIMCSRTLLTQETWTEFAYSPKRVPENGSDILFELCRNLVTLDTQSKVVRFVHLSVHEYLENTFDPVDTHSMAAVCCLLVLSLASDPKAKDMNTARAKSSPIEPELYRYSTNYWSDHVERSHSRDKPMSSLVVDGLHSFMGTATHPAPAYNEWLGNNNIWTLKSHPTTFFFALSYFSFGDHQQLWDGVRRQIHCENYDRQSFLHVACMSGNELAVKMLLENGANIDGFNRDNKSALMTAIYYERLPVVYQLLANGAKLDPDTNLITEIARTCSLKTVLTVMDRDSSIRITEQVIIAAAGNKSHAPELLDYLCIQDPTIKFTQAVLIAALRSPYASMGYLLSIDWDFPHTEPVLMAFAMNGSCHVTVGWPTKPGTTSCQRMFHKLFDEQPSTHITDAVQVTLAKHHGACYCLMTLLSRHPWMVDLCITAMISNLSDLRFPSDGALEMLFRDRKISETWLVAAAKNDWCWNRIICLLLAIDPDAEITDNVMIAAIRNERRGGGMMEVLVKAKNINLTGMVLMVDITGWGPASKTMTYLLENYTGFSLPEEVLLMLVGNLRGGKSKMGMLAGHTVTANLTEAVLIEVVRNERSAEWNIATIRTWDLKITITEAVVRAAGDYYFTKWKAIKLLLSDCKNTSVTEGAAAAIVQSGRWGLYALQEIFDRDDDPSIYQQIIESAVRNPSCACRMIHLLVQRGLLADTTNPVVVAAGGGSNEGPGSFREMRLTRLGPQIPFITQELLIAAARDPDCGDSMMYELLAIKPNIMVFESVVKAAAENPKRGKQAIIMLLSRRHCDNITQQAMRRVVGNEQWGMAWVEALLDSGPSTNVIRMIVRAAASNRPRGIWVIGTLLARYLGPQSGALSVVRWAVQGVFESSALDFETIVESSDDVATEPVEGSWSTLCPQCDC